MDPILSALEYQGAILDELAVGMEWYAPHGPGADRSAFMKCLKLHKVARRAAREMALAVGEEAEGAMAPFHFFHGGILGCSA